MWFKKKSQIGGFNAYMGYDGTNWSSNGYSNSWPVLNTLPSAADANNYFYLPALGEYFYDQLRNLGNYGCYWSSSAFQLDSFAAYSLYFDSGSVSVYNKNRYGGFRIDGFE